MKIKVYVIDFETPKWLRKALAYVVPAIVVVGAGAVVGAAPQQWSGGQTLLASDLNKLAVVTNGSASYSVGATKYCGQTSSMVANSVGGYTGAKTACQNVAACSSSQTAHMCTSDELVRSAQLGIIVPSGWYAIGIIGYTAGATQYSDDCGGFTGAYGGGLSAKWNHAGTQGPDVDHCTNSNPVLCCD